MLEKYNKYLGTVIVLIFILLLGGIRWYFPERPPDYVGMRGWLDGGFAVGLLGLVLLLGTALGWKIIDKLQVSHLNHLEKTVFAMPLGMGIVAYGVLGIGLLGLLRPSVLILWLSLLAIWSWPVWSHFIDNLPWGLRQLKQGWQELGIAQKLLLAGGGLIFGLSSLQALTPPWDYDGLMYHLQGPRLFLQMHRIQFLSEPWPANYPFNTEMIYTVGLAFGSDVFAKLFHLSCAVWLLGATFCVGQRFLGRLGGWLAAGILLGIPTYPIWGSLAYIDMFWSLNLFLALTALLRWNKEGHKTWLILAGLMMGLALGSKYLALGQGFVLGVWLLWQSRKEGWQTVLQNGLIFGGIALLIASPWYLKNWLWTGNPIYPLFFGGPGWDAERLMWLNAHNLGSFGTGRTLVDYLLLPLNLYINYGKFATFLGNTEIASFLFPLILFYPWTRKPRKMDSVAIISLLWFIVWAIGPQHTRFLLPLFPGLSLLTATIFTDLMTRLPRPKTGQILAAGLIGGVITTTLIYALIWSIDVRPLSVISGVISKDTFLSRKINQYETVQYLRKNLPADAKVLMMWDSQGYYCDHRCLPDIEQARWTRLVTSPPPDPPHIAQQLKANGITHLLLDIGEFKFVSEHDATTRHTQAAHYFLDVFAPACTEEIYQANEVSLFELNEECKTQNEE